MSYKVKCAILLPNGSACGTCGKDLVGKRGYYISEPYEVMEEGATREDVLCQQTLYCKHCIKDAEKMRKLLDKKVSLPKQDDKMRINSTKCRSQDSGVSMRVYSQPIYVSIRFSEGATWNKYDTDVLTEMIAEEVQQAEKAIMIRLKDQEPEIAEKIFGLIFHSVDRNV